MKRARKRAELAKDDTDTDSDDAELNENAKRLRKAIASRWAHSMMTSKEVCDLSYLITRPGAAKGLKDFSVELEAKGENYNRKMVRALKLEDIDDECYLCPTHVYDRHKDKRTEIMMPIRLPHEALRKHFLENPSQFDPRQVDSRHWDVPAYTKHPIVRTHDNVTGLGLYRDKVALFRQTGFIRMSINIIWVRKRISIYYILTM